jgi:hypothetical protein
MDEVAACQPYDEELQTGCAGENCSDCVLTRFICIDCQQFETCDKKFKPKILSSNRRALSLYGLCQKFSVMPYAGGILDQPARLISQFQIIMDEVAKQDEIERKKLRDR